MSSWVALHKLIHLLLLKQARNVKIVFEAFSSCLIFVTDFNRVASPNNGRRRASRVPH